MYLTSHTLTTVENALDAIRLLILGAGVCVDGVCNHMGSLNGGHYTAFARNAGDDQWYQYNDERVSRIAAQEVAGPEAYVLYYERMDTDGQPY